MNRLAVQCFRLGQRQLGTSAPRQAVKGEVHPGYKKIKEKYAHFQIDDGTPIHLKGGPFDRVLYYATMVGCGIGVAGCFEYIYRASFPKKD
ncbi:cytochrome c oxidase subunit 7A2, mitochondrial [Folsomia candida]|uniref:cytochrome c oxidase subunit 7A2, mitochondrial n=1 Tax=Folsomia candida TaxID=158441 RepID=UPI000B8F3F6D|nr:cytochrome c oxidase subunit 7A2, mitochondrial [Folsomia candida]